MTRLFPQNEKMYCPCCNMKFHAFDSWDYKELSDDFDSKRYENTRQDK